MSFNRLNVLLGLAALLLAGLLFAELKLFPDDWMERGSTASDSSNTPPGVAVLDADAWRLPADELPDLDSLDETVNRPLFIAGRRPVEEQTAAAPEAPAVDAPASPPPTIKLTAIVLAGQEPIAYALDPTTSSVLRMREGERVEGWEVASITADGLELRQRERLEFVGLRPPAGPPPPPPPKRPSRQELAERQRSAEGEGGETRRERVARLREDNRGGAADDRRTQLEEDERRAREEAELHEIEELEAAIEEQERELRELESDG